MEQRSNEWFQARLGKATASRFNDLMATGRAGQKLAGYKNYKAELVAERLTGQKYDSFQSKEMMWGTENEPLARLRYSMAARVLAEECGFYTHDKLAAGASPDGLVGPDGLVEIKCPNTATHIDTLHAGAIPRQYMAQVQGQMWITGRKWVDFVSFDPRLPDNANFIIVRVPRDDLYIKELEAATTAFLADVDAEVEYVKNYGQRAPKPAKEVKANA